MPIDGPLDRESVKAQCSGKRPQLLIVADFVWSDDPQPPARILRLEPRPGADQTIEAFLGMYATKRKDGAFRMVCDHRTTTQGRRKIYSVGNDSDRIN